MGKPALVNAIGRQKKPKRMRVTRRRQGGRGHRRQGYRSFHHRPHRRRRGAGSLDRIRRKRNCGTVHGRPKTGTVTFGSFNNPAKVSAARNPGRPPPRRSTPPFCKPFEILPWGCIGSMRLHQYEAAVLALAEAGVIQPWPIRLKAEQAERANRDCIVSMRLYSMRCPMKRFSSFAGLALPIAYAQMLSVGQLGLFQELERLRARLAPAPAAAIPESLDSLFGISTGDTINFDEFIGSDRARRDINK
jgi:hypothetical protein